MNIREEIEKMDAQEDSSKGGMMDIRFFIGLLLLIYGVILTIYGLFRPDLASISLNINLNFYWGLVLIVIGLLFFIFSDKPNKWA